MFRPNALLSFLTLSLAVVALVYATPAHSSHGRTSHHHSGSGYKLLLAGYNGTVAPYTYTPPDKLVPAGDVLTDVGASPSWVSFSPDHSIIYTTDETPSTVYAVRVGEEGNPSLDKRTSNANTTLASVDKASTGGFGPVSSAPYKNLLFVANYNAGSTSVHQLTTRGHFVSEQPDQVWEFHREPKGSIGPVPSRQNQSYAHEVSIEPSGRWVYVPDLGADRLHRLEIPDNGQAKDVKLVGETKVAEGSGPRHIAFYRQNRNSPTHAYLASELATTLTAFEVSQEDGSLSIIGQPQLAVPEGVDLGGNATTGHIRTTSEVAVTPDGNFVYVGTRHDEVEDHIAIFQRNADDGSVKFQEWVASGGRNLRHVSTV